MADQYDPKYEFEAPQFLDFEDADSDEDADQWFGTLRLCCALCNASVQCLVIVGGRQWIWVVTP
jgi:hypothetical protein